MNHKHTYTALAALIAIGIGWGATWTVERGVVAVAFPSSMRFGETTLAQNEMDDNSLPATSNTNAKDSSVDAKMNSQQLTASTNNVQTTNVSPAQQASVIDTLFQKKNDTLTIMMGGDVMFDRNVRKLAQTNGYGTLLAPLIPLFDKADITSVNLEGPITTSPSKTLFANGKTGSELTFTFDPRTATALADTGIDTVSLANNHTANFGRTGFAETEKFLDAAGVAHFGNPWNETPETKVISKNGISVAFVGYHEFNTGFPGIIAEVKKLKKAGNFVIVMPHWGIEYEPHPSARQKGEAQELVTAGADAVIGAHPHVIEDHVWLTNVSGEKVPVIYSLGNLLFDQYFSPETMKGEIAELDLVKNGTGATLQGIKLYTTSTASKTDVTYDDAGTLF